jgi:hypothetical protein
MIDEIRIRPGSPFRVEFLTGREILRMSGSGQTEARRSAVGRALKNLGILAFAMAATAAQQTSAKTPTKDQVTTVKAIAFAKGTLDRTHLFYWRGWTIGFGAVPPYGAYPERGMELHGLRCGQPGARHLGCYLLMSMNRIESRPHYCEMLPDSPKAEGPWPLLIACPSRIEWKHTEQ